MKQQKTNDRVFLISAFFWQISSIIFKTRDIYMSHFSYTCKMRYPLNLVLENCKYLWFY